MRMPRLVAISATALLLVAGTAACSSDDSGSTPKKSSSATSTPSADATDEKSTEPTEDKSSTPADDESTSSSGSSEEFCAAAKTAFTGFDATSIDPSDPASIRDFADSFRTVGESATPGEVQDAWISYADMLDLSADVYEDPSDTAKAQELMSLAGDLTNTMTTLTDDLTANCS